MTDRTTNEQNNARSRDAARTTAQVAQQYVYEQTTMIEIPWQQLSESALAGVIEEFVLREGTDYGEAERTFEEKTASLLAQLKRSDIKLVYDPASESCTLVSRK